MSSPSFAHKGLPPDGVLRLRVKSEIRKRLRGLRKATPAAVCAEKSARIVKALSELDALRGADRVALFWPMEERHEVDLRELDASLRARGAEVFYPTILDDGEMIFAHVRDPLEMQHHALGFLAPPVSEAEGAPGIKVIVVPAIALDLTGHRIGYGAGYYDRALAAHPGAATVGVAFDFQLIPEVPATADDVPVHWIVTDRRVLRASSEAALAGAPGEPWGT